MSSTASTTSVAIFAKDLSCDFGSVRAVDRISLSVPCGSILGFLGPNGSGKTTTIRLLLGLQEPTAGQAAVLGFDIRSQANEVRARAGALLEHSGLYERLTAEDNLEYYARIWRLDPTERRARISELLRRMDLWDWRNARVSTMSRGMKQKLAVARAMLHRPEVLFLDEPTAGLDPVSANALRNDLASVAREDGTTVFITTHHLHEAERLCDLVVFIRQGRLLATGTPKELASRLSAPRIQVAARGLTPGIVKRAAGLPGVSGVRLHENLLEMDVNDDFHANRLLTKLIADGVAIQTVTHAQADLEAAFLTLMQEDPS